MPDNLRWWFGMEGSEEAAKLGECVWIMGDHEPLCCNRRCFAHRMTTKVTGAHEATEGTLLK
jgi:hypothetical protein